MQAITALFVLLTGSAFGDVTAPGMDSVGVGRQPFITYSGWSAVYFVAYMLIAFLFIGNLFVGIILDNYAQRVRAFGPGAMLTDKQKVRVPLSCLLQSWRGDTDQVLPFLDGCRHGWTLSATCSATPPRRSSLLPQIKSAG